MKKITAILLTMMITASLQAFATGIAVQPTFYSRTNAQDRVWVGTFQLVWNDFMDKIIHNPVRFREGTPIIAQELNKRTFSTDDISEKSFYKYTGKVTKNTKKQIKKALKKKFKETSDILDKLDLSPQNDMFIIYTMLKKDFEFINEFDKLEKSAFKQNKDVEFFGIDKNSDNKLDKGVSVLFYNNPNDFAVMLSTRNNDEVFLYKNASNKAFNYIWADMQKKHKTFKGESSFKNLDELKVPNISFFEEKAFDELTNKRIMGTNYIISQAIETIKFDMDNKGVKLKSEAAMTVMTTALLPENTSRKFYFDDTFVIFLKEKQKQKPYFALRVNDISKFQN